MKKKKPRPRIKNVSDEMIFCALLKPVVHSVDATKSYWLDPNPLSINELGEVLGAHSVDATESHWMKRILNLVGRKFVTKVSGFSKETGRPVIQFEVTHENLLNYLDSCNEDFLKSGNTSIEKLLFSEMFGARFPAFRKIIATPFFWKLLKRIVVNTELRSKRTRLNREYKTETIEEIIGIANTLFQHDLNVRARILMMERNAEVVETLNAYSDESFTSALLWEETLTSLSEHIFEELKKEDDAGFKEYRKTVLNYAGEEAYEAKIKWKIAETQYLVNEYKRTHGGRAGAT